MSRDRLERLMVELQDEVERRGPSEEERERLAEWFSGVLESDRRRNERTVSITEMFRRAHGLGEAKPDDDSEAPPSSAA